ncbi:CHAT domain-containing protein [Sphaerisporangium sp. B11E5]|uniref:CHAT domain-containing protein n=1 Tax=Sphaerisporangium sp. B11E5 TaxID=3153563 RepID=UPI00325E910A
MTPDITLRDGEALTPPGPFPDETTGNGITATSWGELVAAAEEAVRMCGADPAAARRRAGAVLARAVTAGCAEAVSVAHRALALAAREFGRLALAAEHLDKAVAAAEHLPARAAQARLSLVPIRADLGDPVGALEVADAAEAHLAGLDQARLGVQRAVALVRLGRHAEAVARCDTAVTALTGDPKFLAGALLNRGIALTYLERYDAASRDLAACATVAGAAGLGHISALAQANLPFVAAKRGDIPSAFAAYRRAVTALAPYPERLAAMRADFADALLAAHLPGEARAVLAQAVPDLAAAGALVALAESRLILAQIELLLGDPRQARATAAHASAELSAQGRHTWVSLAMETTFRARLAEELPPPGSPLGTTRPGEVPACAPALLAEARTLAARLAADGWAGPAAGVRLTAAELALGLGNTGAARAELAHVLSGRPAARAHRAVRHHAAALERSLRGDTRGAQAELRAGLRAATAGSDRLTDPAVRAHAVRAGERLADLGLSLALADGRPEPVLAWAEHWRALARGRPMDPLTPDRLRTALNGAALVELIRHGDTLSAVVITETHCALRPLGSLTSATEATLRLRHTLRRPDLATGHSPAAHGHLASGPHQGAQGHPTAQERRAPGGRAPVRRAQDDRAVSTAAAALAEQLLAPLAGEIGDRPLVIVPTGPLHTLPWSSLPPLRGRPLCVASSAASWLSVALRPPPTGSAGRHASPRRPLVAAVPGPGLAHATAEAATVSRIHGALEPPLEEATVPRVLDILGEADIAHIAAHGRFCARSPLLSSLALHDGPLMAYDILALPRVPWLVVLSACDAGMAYAPVDGTALGLPGAFLDRGSACVVAGLLPVRDQDAQALMTTFHTHLADGGTPAEALAAATERTAVPGFTCFGSLGHPLTG